MATQNRSTRETRAQALLDSGAVSLFVGKGFAYVRGSGDALYKVTSDGCTCPDFAKRGPGCKHEIAVRRLCAMYREHRSEARATGRTRMPAALAKALANATPLPSHPCRECGAPTIHDVCSGCFFQAAAR